MPAESELQAAFVLHARPYRNSSLIVDFFTEQHGRISAVARSARGPKSRFKGILQPFSALMVSWGGKHELKYLAKAELAQAVPLLQGKHLLCGFYLNELLLKLLQGGDAHPQVFHDYQHTLLALSQAQALEPHLRRFEKRLLDELGYGLSAYEWKTQTPLQADCYYHFIPERGFAACDANDQSAYVFRGERLQAILAEDFSNAAVQQDAKRLMRILFGLLLGDKPLNSRELLS